MLRLVLSLTTALCLATPLLAEKSADQYIQDLNSSDPAVQMQACRALGAAKATAATGALTDLLQNSTDEHVAATAAAALGAIGEKGAPALALATAAGEHESTVVRYAALVGLLQIGDDAQKAAARTAAEQASQSSDALLKDLAMRIQARFQ